MIAQQMLEKSVNATSYSESRLSEVRNKIREMGRGAISLISENADVDKTTLGRFVGGKQDISASKFLRIEFELARLEKKMQAR